MIRLTTEEIRVRGLAALKKELGRAGLARFLRHFKSGAGDYTRTRNDSLKDLTLAELRNRVRARKRRAAPVGVRRC